MAKKIICTVTNDLTYDQRMMRICTSLAGAGYDVLLVGRKRKSSKDLIQQKFQQKRLPCFFDKGKWFYIEYNIRLFIYLLFQPCSVYCAIDLDTILPVLYASKIRRKKRVYDAHELFCEMEEIVSRPAIYRMWKWIEKHAVPQFQTGYTIGDCYAEQFKQMYHVNYEVVRNATVLKPLPQPFPERKYILYQGAVNEGRSFETLIPAMKKVNAHLMICGHGNFFNETKKLIEENQLQDKITLKGYVAPAELIRYTQQAIMGITLFTQAGKSNYFSMANRFFDYMHSAVPQICMKYPEYEKVNAKFEVACLVEGTTEEEIANAIQSLLNNKEQQERMQQNCLKAREIYCWQQEEIKLIHVYRKLLGE